MQLIRGVHQINGCRVLARRKVSVVDGKPVYLVMLDRGEQQKRDRYVTAKWVDGNQEWDHGNYHDSIVLASRDYNKRT